MMLNIIKIILILWSLSLSYSFSLAPERALRGFLDRMTQGTSVFCIEYGMPAGGALISDYQIQDIQETKNNIVMTVHYTETGRYSVDEAVFEIKPRLYKNPISKTARYSFLKTPQRLQIQSMEPNDCLLLHNP